MMTPKFDKNDELDENEQKVPKSLKVSKTRKWVQNSKIGGPKLISFKIPKIEMNPKVGFQKIATP
jgi:hypothetical protein